MADKKHYYVMNSKEKLTFIGGYVLRIVAAIFLLFLSLMIFLIILNNVIRPLWGLVRKVF